MPALALPLAPDPDLFSDDDETCQPLRQRYLEAVREQLLGASERLSPSCSLERCQKRLQRSSPQLRSYRKPVVPRLVSSTCLQPGEDSSDQSLMASTNNSSAESSPRDPSSPRSGLTDLPDDVVHCIALRLRRRSLHALANTCRRYQGVLMARAAQLTVANRYMLDQLHRFPSLSRLHILAPSSAAQVPLPATSLHSALTQLTSLRLTCKSVNMAAFLSCTRLRSLTLDSPACDYGATDDNLLALASLSHLETLRLPVSTQATDAGVAHLCRLSRLSTLSIPGWKRITLSSASSVASLSALASLDVSRCEAVSDAGFAHVCALPSLTSLTADNLPAVGPTATAGLSHATQLTHLSLCHCALIDDDALPPLARLTRIRSLDISENPSISDAGLLHLSGLTSLQSLTLTGLRRVTDNGVAHIASLPELSALVLRACGDLTWTGLRALSALPALTVLDVGDNVGIADLELASISCMPCLRSLGLANCAAVSDVGAGYLCDLPQLQVVDLTGCNAVSRRARIKLRTLCKVVGR